MITTHRWRVLDVKAPLWERGGPLVSARCELCGFKCERDVKLCEDIDVRLEQANGFRPCVGDVGFGSITNSNGGAMPSRATIIIEDCEICGHVGVACVDVSPGGAFASFPICESCLPDALPANEHDPDTQRRIRAGIDAMAARVPA